MTNSLARTRDLDSWIYCPTIEDTICVNPFHEIVYKVYNGYSPLDPFAPNPYDISTKIASLMKAQLILLGGDVIYVREGDTLHTLGDSLDLLGYYMHTDSKEARKAADLLEANFQGYFPICDNLVWRDVMRLNYPDGSYSFINLKTLEPATIGTQQFPEFGSSDVQEDNYGPLYRYFYTMNAALGEPFFLEKTMMYHFNQKFREKSHVLVGGGGNGKSMFMGLVQRLYGDFALTDAPQPNFTGHAAAVVAYNFIGKRIVTFNDVGDPSAKFLEWLKRMITGKLEVKTPSGAWLTVPCTTNFIMETNHAPQVLNIPAHKRRYIVREFDPTFQLADYLSQEDLNALSDRGTVSAADIVNYLTTIKDQIDDWTKFGEQENINWCEEEVPA